MKKTITVLLVAAFVFAAPALHSQTIQTNRSSTHPHQHLSPAMTTIVYDPFGTGQIKEYVSMQVDLAAHPGLSIVHSSMYISYETWDDHFILADQSGTSDFYAQHIEYNWNDPPYWLSYSFEVYYSDGTYETESWDIYF